MPKIKPRHLEPQRTLGYHGAIRALAEVDIPAGAIVVVTGATTASLTVQLASPANSRLSKGMLFTVRNGVLSGDLADCYTFQVIPTVDQKKDGAPVWLVKEGRWSFHKPKNSPIQVGTFMVTDSGNRVLLAPQGRY